MILGIYLPTLADHNILGDIGNAINNNIGKKIQDASIFYDNIAYNPFNIMCGLFNSTDIWNFSGTLIVPSLSTLTSSLKIVNDIDLWYYYGWENKISTLSLIYITTQNIKVVAKTEDDAKDFYRKTKRNPNLVSGSFSNLVEKLK